MFKQSVVSSFQSYAVIEKGCFVFSYLTARFWQMTITDYLEKYTVNWHPKDITGLI